MSNKSMPGLVKVGFSTKDPDLRAQELNHTGTPHPYVVDYEALVHEPYQVEQRAHVLLLDHSEGKEWFRCTPEQAIAALKKATNDTVLHETFRKADRSLVESQREAERLAAEEDRIKRERESNARKRLEERAAVVRSTHEDAMKALIVERPFWQFWLGGSVIVFFVLAILAPNMKEGLGVYVMVAIFGAVVGGLIQSGSVERQQKKPEYIAAKEAMEKEIKEILEPTVSCNKCSSTFSFDPVKIVLAGTLTMWQCPKCKGPLHPR